MRNDHLMAVRPIGEAPDLREGKLQHDQDGGRPVQGDGKGIVAGPVIACQGACSGGQGCRLGLTHAVCPLWKQALPCVETPGGWRLEAPPSPMDCRLTTDC